MKEFGEAVLRFLLTTLGIATITIWVFMLFILRRHLFNLVLAVDPGLERNGCLPAILQFFLKFLSSERSTPATLKLSVAHPKLLSKRFAAPFRVTIYPPGRQKEVAEELKRTLQKWDMEEYIDDTDLTAGLTVVIKLSSQDVDFMPEEITKKLGDKINEANFMGKPKESASPGPHIVLLSIADSETDHEYVSKPFEVKVVDYAFDHVSRPLLSRLTSAVAGLAALVTYALTLFGQIDEVFGLASGTAAGAVAAIIYVRFSNLYRRPSAAMRVGTRRPDLE